MTRILIGMLGSNGDCLYATAIARQIKQDFPGCHLTWAISSLCSKILRNNPDIDEIWEVPVASWPEVARAWMLFEIDAHELASRGQFDHIFLPQIWPAHFANYDGTIRPSIFRNFGRPINVPVDVTIDLEEAEIAAVDDWFKQSPAADASEVVLFESASKSGQSFMTAELAMQLAEAITAARPKASVILSSHDAKPGENPRILSAAHFSVRQIARLTHQVDLFVGCGSGLTVAATSGTAKQGLANIQVLNRHTSVYASFRHDFAYYGKPVDQFLELMSTEPEALQTVILSALVEGFATAKASFDEPVPLTFDWYYHMLKSMLIDQGRHVEAMHSVLVTAERYGWHPSLKLIGGKIILPVLKDDPRSVLPHHKAEAEILRAGVA
jgi:hypothetical protein